MTTNGDPGAFLQQAQLLERTGRFAEAEAAYLRLLARWPQLTDTWYNLGRLQRRMGRFDAALASYQQALDRGIAHAEEVHLNRGVIYSDCLRQPAAAEQELHQALALNPNYVPALFNLANLHEDRGSGDAALVLYEKILQLEPGYHEALARYSGLRTSATADQALIARLQQSIADSATGAADKASLGFALGKLLDAGGTYDAAFAAYADANRYSRASAAPDIALYDRHRHEQFIDAMIAAFPAPVPAMSPAIDARPLFICGMFRSGSTLTEQVLAAHSQVTAGGELGLLPTIVHRQLAPFPAAMSRITPQQLQTLAGHYLDALSRLFPGAHRVTDKRPDNFLYIGLIKRLFPHAKIIHTARNPLDNCLSIFFLHLDHSMGYALDLMDIGHYYTQYRRLMSHWKSLYANDILDFEYDTFVRDPRSATQTLLSFCDLDWEESCLSFDKLSNAVRTASVWQVRQPVYRQSCGRWHNYAAQMTSLREYLQSMNVDTGDAAS